MAPKRKSSAKSQPATKLKSTVSTIDNLRSEVVIDVIQGIQPMLIQAVKEAVTDATSNTSQPCLDVLSESAPYEDDSDLNIMFIQHEIISSWGEISNPLHLHLSQSLLDKIKQGKYVNLAELLNPDDRIISLNISSGGRLEVRNRIKVSPITSCDQWFSAVLIFASVYGFQCESQQNQLFKYMSCVQAIHKAFGLESALNYDSDFRKLKVSLYCLGIRFTKRLICYQLLSLYLSIKQNRSPFVRTAHRTFVSNITPQDSVQDKPVTSNIPVTGVKDHTVSKSAHRSPKPQNLSFKQNLGYWAVPTSIKVNNLAIVLRRLYKRVRYSLFRSSSHLRAR